LLCPELIPRKPGCLVRSVSAASLISKPERESRIDVTNYELVLLIAAGSIGAGFLGALTGLGGGVVIVPMLTLLFGVDLRYAIGASLGAAGI